MIAEERNTSWKIDGKFEKRVANFDRVAREGLRRYLGEEYSRQMENKSKGIELRGTCVFQKQYLALQMSQMVPGKRGGAGDTSLPLEGSWLFF